LALIQHFHFQSLESGIFFEYWSKCFHFQQKKDENFFVSKEIFPPIIWYRQKEMSDNSTNNINDIFYSNLSGKSDPIMPQISQRKQDIIIPKEKEKIMRPERPKILNFENKEKYEIQIKKILKPKDEIRRKIEFRKDDSIFPNILKKIEKKEEVKEKPQEKKIKKMKNIYKKEEGNSTILFIFSFLKLILIFLGILSETKKKEPEMDLNLNVVNKLRKELEEAIQIGDEKRASFLGRELARMSK
jgi:hypothetical protein